MATMMFMRGRISTALCVLMVALAACGPVATSARIAPGGEVAGIRTQDAMERSALDDVFIPVGDDIGQGDIHAGRSLMKSPGKKKQAPKKKTKKTKKLPCASFNPVPTTCMPPSSPHACHLPEPE